MTSCKDITFQSRCWKPFAVVLASGLSVLTAGFSPATINGNFSDSINQNKAGQHNGAQVLTVQFKPPRIRKMLRAKGYSHIEFTDKVLPIYKATACRKGARYKLTVNRWGDVRKARKTGSCDSGRDRLNPPAIRKVLQNRGFKSIKFVDRQLPVYIVEACNINGNRMELRLNRYGKISRRARVGVCASGSISRKHHVTFTLKDIRRRLRRRGFSRITFIDRRSPPRSVEACRSGRLYRISLNDYGQVKRSKYKGGCNRLRVSAPHRDHVHRAPPHRPAHSHKPHKPAKVKPGYALSEIVKILNDRGYYSVGLTDRHLPGYKANACRRGHKFALRFNRWGEIKRRKRIGWCGSVKVERHRHAPVIRFESHEIASSERVSASVCQDYFDSLVSDTKVHFTVASSRISQTSHGLLTRLARVARRCPGAMIEVVGHTDSDGSASANHRLSHARAASVSNHLVRLGVASNRLVPVGYGETQPLVPNSSYENKALNRRTEFIINWDEPE